MATLNLESVIRYIYSKNRTPQDPGVSRLVKMLYLADWKHCIDCGYQITDAQWQIISQRPYSDKVYKTLREIKEFEIEIIDKSQSFDSGNFIITLKPGVSREDLIKEIVPHIPMKVFKTIDYVIKVTSSMAWHELDELVNSTHPMIVSPQAQILDLEQLAKDYNELNNSNVEGQLRDIYKFLWFKKRGLIDSASAQQQYKLPQSILAYI